MKEPKKIQTKVDRSLDNTMYPPGRKSLDRTIPNIERKIQCAYITPTLSYSIGSTCSSIIIQMKPGIHNDIPYIRVYDYNGKMLGEFCQYNIIGITFS